jgi:hypothetical protein
MSNDSRGGVAGEAPGVGADTIELRMWERIRAPMLRTHRSRAMVLAPHNTEFSGEPAALPSLVRCNSLFAGGYDARLTEACTASGRSTATKRFAANR